MVNQDGLYLFLKFEDGKINQNYQNLIKRVLNQNYLSFLSILSIIIGIGVCKALKLMKKNEMKKEDDKSVV